MGHKETALSENRVPRGAEGVICKWCVLVQDKAFGINGHTVESNFIVKVRPGASSGTPDITDQFTAGYNLSAFDRNAVEMSKSGGQTCVVFEANTQAIGTIPTSKGDGPTGW